MLFEEILIFAGSSGVYTVLSENSRIIFASVTLYWVAKPSHRSLPRRKNRPTDQSSFCSSPKNMGGYNQFSVSIIQHHDHKLQPFPTKKISFTTAHYVENNPLFLSGGLLVPSAALNPAGELYCLLPALIGQAAVNDQLPSFIGHQHITFRHAVRKFRQNDLPSVLIFTNRPAFFNPINNQHLSVSPSSGLFSRDGQFMAIR